MASKKSHGYWPTDVVVVRLANLILKLASPHYRKMLQGTLNYGLIAVQRDAEIKANKDANKA